MSIESACRMWNDIQNFQNPCIRDCLELRKSAEPPSFNEEPTPNAIT